MPPALPLIEPPSPGTWCYAAFAVAIALFYLFRRPFALRNVDLVALFAFAPGLLLVESAHRKGGNPLVGYGWLLGASLFWFVRCLLDAGALKKARLSANLATPGLFWLAGALLIGLGFGAATTSSEPKAYAGRSAAVARVEDGAVAVVKQANPEDVPAEEVRKVVEVGLAIVCQIAVAVLLVAIGRRHFQQWSTGAIAATLYLLMPDSALHFGQSHRVWPTAFILAALLAFRKPARAGALLGLAAGTSFFPLLLVPAWVQFYRGRGVRPFLIWFGGVTSVSFVLTLAGLAVASDYTAGLWQTLHLAEWQPWRVPKSEGLWTGLQWAYRLPVFIAFLGFALGTFVWPSSRDLGQLLAASAAILLSVQFWLADGGGQYVQWFSPLLILMVLRPTSVDLQPPSPHDPALLRFRRSTGAAQPAPGLAV